MDAQPVSKNQIRRERRKVSLSGAESSGRNRFQHGAEAGLKSDFSQPGVADTGIEDACTGAIVVVPDHRGQSVVITQGVGKLTPGELEIIHKVIVPWSRRPKAKSTPRMMS